ncbi:MAG: TubC N-terminal docking domain-related protein [Acidithiobacillus sp.]
MKSSNPSPMAASSLLAELRAEGFTLTAEGSRLRVAPADSLTDELRQRIKEHRAEIVALLAAESTPAVRSATDMPPQPRKCSTGQIWPLPARPAVPAFTSFPIPSTQPKE